MRSSGILHFSDETGEVLSNTTVFVSLLLFMLLGALGREKYGIDEFRFVMIYHRGAGDRPEMTTILVPLHSMHSTINQQRELSQCYRCYRFSTGSDDKTLLS